MRRFRHPKPASCGRGPGDRFRIRPWRRAGFGLVAALLAANPALAGDFSLNWGTAPYTWTAGATGPVSITMTDQYGFQVGARMTISRTGGAAVSGYPDDLAGFGTNTSLWLVWDAGANSGRTGESTNTATLEFLVNGSPFALDGLQFQITDIDATDNNNASDRCDFVTVTGNAGNPTLTYVHGTASQRSVRIGPQNGSGSTGALAANQAQCIYNTGTTTSPTSNGDNFGSILAAFPAGTHTATIDYDESIENVYNANRDAAARGIGVWGGSAFVVNTTISLTKSPSVTTYTATGQVVTYTYVVTNTGRLAINTGQNIQIQDDKIGTFACGTVSTEIAPGGTISCTANYTVTASDLLAANVTNNAVAGVGTGTQSFASRLQSNNAQATITNGAINAVDDNFSGSAISGTTGGATATVFTNDTLAGAAFANAAVVGSIDNDGGLTGVSIGSDGRLAIPASTTAGTYAVTYRICQASAPANCDTAVATVAVSVAPPSGGSSCAAGSNLASNFGFELPNYTGGPIVHQETSVPNWTTTDTTIEIWDTGFNGVASHTGDQHAEINANIAGTLTQTVTGIAGRAEVKVFWAHRARQGTDTASLTIADNGGGATAYGNFSTTTAAWVVRTATHVAQPGATTVYASFAAVSTGSGNISIGNFLDTVEVCQTYLAISKTAGSKTDADGSGGDSAGDTVGYTFVVSNPAGNHASIGSVSVIDDKLGTIAFAAPVTGDANANGFLDPGESWTVTASHVFTQAELDAGDLVNVAYAQGSTADSSIRSGDATATVPLTAAPALTLVKSHAFTSDGGTAGIADAGDVIGYAYVLTNTGNITFFDVGVTDTHNANGPLPDPAHTGLADNGPAGDSPDNNPDPAVWGRLAPGDSVSFATTYTTLQADLDLLQ